MRHVNCNLCSSKNYSVLFKVGNSSVVKCDNCGFKFLNPIPVERDLMKYYSNLSSSKIELLDKSPVEYEQSLQRIKLIEIYVKKGKILDVGSGCSNFVVIAKERGWNVSAVEIREESKRLLKKFLIKSVEEKKIENNYFNCITLSQVLEHVSDPSKKLKLYYKKLIKGGIVVIEVPNIESLGFKLLKNKWYFIMNPQHISYFSKKTLTKMLEKAGFEIIKTEYLGAVFASDLAGGGKVKKEYVFNLYRFFKIPINLMMKIIRKAGLSDTMRIVAKKP